MPASVSFVVKRFGELSVRELHDIFRLRCTVFVVEQRCIYADVDGADPRSTHLLGFSGGSLAAYARWYWAGPQVVIGRIVVHPEFRGRGYGRPLMAAALDAIGTIEVRMHAQAHLEGFYESCGFVRRGDPFDEDDIPHLLMVRPAPEAPIISR